MSTIAPSVHIKPEQYHLAWDRSIEPIATVASGDVVEFQANDAGNAQLNADSTVDDLLKFDFDRTDQVNGPIAVKGAEPGDTL
jgi:acetamidase/formamidase